MVVEARGLEVEVSGLVVVGNELEGEENKRVVGSGQYVEGNTLGLEEEESGQVQVLAGIELEEESGQVQVLAEFGRAMMVVWGG